MGSLLHGGTLTCPTCRRSAHTADIHINFALRDALQGSEADGSRSTPAAVPAAVASVEEEEEFETKVCLWPVKHDSFDGLHFPVRVRDWVSLRVRNILGRVHKIEGNESTVEFEGDGFRCVELEELVKLNSIRDVIRTLADSHGLRAGLFLGGDINYVTKINDEFVLVFREGFEHEIGDYIISWEATVSGTVREHGKIEKISGIWAKYKGDSVQGWLTNWFIGSAKVMNMKREALDYWVFTLLAGGQESPDWRIPLNAFDHLDR